ncbi:MAG: ferredoxin [Gammaproteobacteria bacterium]|nr:ferredoxin [Gammaproteobacteria bacterium]
MHIHIDYSACEGCGACADVYPELFEMRDSLAWLLGEGPSDTAQCQEIARVCPFGAIVVSG